MVRSFVQKVPLLEQPAASVSQPLPRVGVVLEPVAVAIVDLILDGAETVGAVPVVHKSYVLDVALLSVQ